MTTFDEYDGAWPPVPDFNPVDETCERDPDDEIRCLTHDTWHGRV